MRANDVTPQRLRELVGRRPPRGKVLSLYLDLDPSQFGTIPARSSAVTSLLDDARRRVEDAQLEHDDRAALREDLARVEELLDPAALPADGAAALAVFASGPADLLEVLRLPRPVASRAVVADGAQVAPLAELASSSETWCVLLVSRGTARFLLGTRDALAEEHEIHQPEFDREVPSEFERHFRDLASTLLRTLKEGRWDRLLVGGPHEQLAPFAELLDNEVRERLAGTFDADAEVMTPEQVRAHVERTAARLRERGLTALLERFEAGLGSGRAVAGEDATRLALEERRVEALLLAGGHEDEAAVRAALGQDAAVHRIGEPEDTPFAAHRIGAVLRF